MAKVLGKSGAWAPIHKELARLGLLVRDPSDIKDILQYLRDNQAASVQKKRTEVDERMAPLEEKIQMLRAEKRLFWQVLNWFREMPPQIKIHSLMQEVEVYRKTLEEKIHTLAHIQNSVELSGAKAEFAVIKELRRLPDNYTVFNDLNLRANRYIHFDGVALQSAQIDHIVLGPSGIFVIETKSWSKEFSERGDYHNPFDQVKRAAYLCYRKVQRIGGVHVRSIIASDGHLPTKPQDSKVKVLRISELAGYIKWFTQNEISPVYFTKLETYLLQHIGGQ